MSDAINSLGGGVTAAPVAQPQTRAPSQDKATETVAKPTGDGLPNKLSGRLLDDPLAGVVVSQQLDSEGYIVAQTPSSSVLAYLRNGLSIDGFKKESVTA